MAKRDHLSNPWLVRKSHKELNSQGLWINDDRKAIPVGRMPDGQVLSLYDLFLNRAIASRRQRVLEFLLQDEPKDEVALEQHYEQWNELDLTPATVIARIQYPIFKYLEREVKRRGLIK